MLLGSNYWVYTTSLGRKIFSDSFFSFCICSDQLSIEIETVAPLEGSNDNNNKSGSKTAGDNDTLDADDYTAGGGTAAKRKENVPASEK